MYWWFEGSTGDQDLYLGFIEKEVCEKTHHATPREKLVADAEAGGDTLLAELWRDDTRSTDEDVRAEIA